MNKPIYFTKQITIPELIQEWFPILDFSFPERAEPWEPITQSTYLEYLSAGFPTASIYILKLLDKYIVLDGKERLGAISGFLTSNYKAKVLSALKEDLMKQTISFVFIENLSMEEAVKWYRATNTARVNTFKAEGISQSVVSLASHPFFEEVKNLNVSLKKAEVHEQLVIMIAMMLDDKNALPSIGYKDIREYLKWVEAGTKYVPLSGIESMADYMKEVMKNLTVRDKRKIFSKENTILICLTAIHTKRRIDPKNYALGLYDLFVCENEMLNKIKALRKKDKWLKENVLQQLHYLIKMVERMLLPASR